jgi:hypothetical protein
MGRPSGLWMVLWMDWGAGGVSLWRTPFGGGDNVWIAAQ